MSLEVNSNEKRERGSVILPVLATLFLITILLSLMILYESYHNVLVMKEVNRTRSYYLAESGLQVVLARLNSLGYGAVNKHFEEKIADVGLFRAIAIPYGGYLLCRSEGISAKETTILHGLLGSVPAKAFDTAINLMDREYPLIISGATTIVGDVSVGNGGVIAGRFKGKGFEGDRLVNGNTYPSDVSNAPEPDLQLYRLFQDSLLKQGEHFDKIFERTVIVEEATEIKLSDHSRLLFEGDLLLRLREKTLDINDRYLRVKGNLFIKESTKIIGFGVIETEGKVEISGHAEVRDCIIFAHGAAVLKDNSVFKAQLISNSLIMAVDSVALRNPSLLFVNTRGLDKPGRITLRSAVSCKGSALLIGDERPEVEWGKKKQVPTIEVSDVSRFEGLVYSTEFVSLSGEVNGNITTTQFYYYEQPTIYLNWVIDAAVRHTDNDKLLMTPVLLGANNGYKYGYYY